MAPLAAAGAFAAEPVDTEWGRVRAYFSAGILFSRGDASFSKQTPFLGFNLDKNWRSGDTLMINSFFETRLTSIPVNTGGFESSEKVAHVAAGFYAPVLTTKWTFHSQRHALFAAPLVSAGFDTPTAAGASRFYSAAAAGARLGHFRFSDVEGAAPELVSWLDVVYGKFTSLDANARRLGVEGTLRAPGTPLVIGFSANIAHSGGAPDDLRLFLGTRFDLGAVIGKLR